MCDYFAAIAQVYHYLSFDFHQHVHFVYLELLPEQYDGRFRYLGNESFVEV